VKDAMGVPFDQLLEKFSAERQIDGAFLTHACILGRFMRVQPFGMKPPEGTEILDFELG
jgi:hypothetical protein